MNQKPQRELILLIGLPGAGKSTYLEKNSAMFEGYEIISADQILEGIKDKVEKMTNINVSFSDIANEFLSICSDVLNRQLYHAVGAGKNIIIDSSNSTISARRVMAQYAKESDVYGYKIIATIIHGPEEKLYTKRLWDRAVQKQHFSSISHLPIRELEPPTLDEVDEIIHIGQAPEKPIYGEYTKSDKMSLKERVNNVKNETDNIGR